MATPNAEVEDGPRSKLGNIFLSLMSQGANSGGNMLLAIFVARHATQEDFGAWALGYAAFMMALIVARALASTPLLLKRHRSSEHLRRSAAGAVALSMGVGLVVGMILVLLTASNPRVFTATVAFAVLLPLLLAQDAVRYFAFARERPIDAAFMDTSWLLLQIILFIVLEDRQAAGSWALTAAWVVAMLPGVLWVVARRHIWPAVRSVPAFWLATRADGLKLLADAAISSAITQTLPVVVAATAGLAAAGSLRGGLTLMGGINILVAGLTPVATMSARREHERTGSFRRFLWGWSAIVLIASSINGAVILSIPDSLGQHLLGSTWLAASALLPPLIIQSMILGPLTGIPVALRATDRVGQALRLRIWTTVPAIVFPWGGAIVFGLQGAVWGILAGAATSNAMYLASQRSHGGMTQ